MPLRSLGARWVSRNVARGATLVALGALVSPLIPGAPPAPFADIHTHFNWDQEEVISAETAAARLREQGVVLAIVSATPADYALKLREAGGEWVVPFVTPYLDPRRRQTWFTDPEVVAAVRRALESGHYFGIGEVHLWAGWVLRRDNPVFQGLLDLAERFDVPMLIHTEPADPAYFLAICRARPEVTFLWAHAGGNVPPDGIGKVLDACPNVWVDLSARDPWRYGGITGEDGYLLPAWRAVVLAYPDRFMVGSDPVWSVRRGQRWDQPDEGWDHLGELLAFHRRWLSTLPPDVEEKVRLTNARRLLPRAQPVSAR
jgi:hypothetical protein